MFREDRSQRFYLCGRMFAGNGEAEVAAGGPARIFDVWGINFRGEKLAAQACRISRGEGDDRSEAIGSGMTKLFPRIVRNTSGAEIVTRKALKPVSSGDDIVGYKYLSQKN